MSTSARAVAGGVEVDIQVVPRASRERLGPWMADGRLKVQLTAPPVDGAANEALVKLLARALGVTQKDVSIVRGETGRKKTLRIAGGALATLLAQVESNA